LNSTGLSPPSILDNNRDGSHTIRYVIYKDYKEIFHSRE
jgi:hypothetical protein